jgi:hypothetical protein
VQPGGKEALECLVRNEPKLLSPCRSETMGSRHLWNASKSKDLA